MKTLKSIFVLLFISFFISCDSDEDSDPITTCESDFFGLHSDSSLLTSTDTFKFGMYHKTSVLGTGSVLSSGNSFSTASGWMQYYTSTFNPSSNELTCMLTTNNRLIKCNTTTGVTTTSTISNVLAPVYIGSSLRLLKYSNVIPTAGFFPAISSVDLQIVDETGVAISTISTKTLSTSSLTSINNITSATDGTKIYYLANCELIIYDIALDTFSVKKIDTSYTDSNRIFYQGLELKDNNTLVALKQSLAANKIEIAAIDISNLSITTLPTTIALNISTLLPSGSPSIPLIINAMEYRTTTYDTCDDNYYFTYTVPSAVAAAETKIFEVKINSGEVNLYTHTSGKILFALEKGM